jgi:hypothetical protein
MCKKHYFIYKYSIKAEVVVKNNNMNSGCLTSKYPELPSNLQHFKENLEVYEEFKIRFTMCICSPAAW